MRVFNFFWQVDAPSSTASILDITARDDDGKPPTPSEAAERTRGAGAADFDIASRGHADPTELPMCKIIDSFDAGAGRFGKVCKPTGDGPRFLVIDDPIQQRQLGEMPVPPEVMTIRPDASYIAAISALVDVIRENDHAVVSCRQCLEEMIQLRWPGAADSILEAIEQSGSYDEETIKDIVTSPVHWLDT